MIDGDSIALADGEKVRLLGIDAPETKWRKTAAQPLGNAAKRALSKLVLNKRVKLVFGVAPTDFSKRTLAYLYLPNGEDVQIKMLAQGLAMFTAYPPDLSHLDAYRNAQADAQRNLRGIWNEPHFAVRDLDDGNAIPKARGPLRIAGTVSDVKSFGASVKIKVADKFTLEISKFHWKQFWRGQDAQDWIGKRVIAQGRISTKGANKMTVRHPSLLTVGE